MLAMLIGSRGTAGRPPIASEAKASSDLRNLARACSSGRSARLLSGFEERKSGPSERVVGSQTGFGRFEFDQPAANLAAVFTRKEGKFLENSVECHAQR